MKTRNATLGFGAFAVVAVAITYLIWSTLQRPIAGETDSYTAIFTTVLGLRVGDDVRVAGVRVGRVDSIERTDDDKARVEFEIRADQVLFGNSRAVVRYQNLIGQRYVALVAGEGELVPLAPGSTIPLERTEGSFEVSALLSGFEPLFSVLAPDDVNALSETLIQALQGDGVSLRTLIAQAAGLAATFSDRDAILGDVVTNLAGVMAGLANRSGELETLIAQTGELTTGLYAQGELLKSAVDQVAGSTAELADLVASIEPGVAQAQNDATTAVGLLIANGASLDQAAVELPDILTGLARFTSYGAYGNAYLCSLDVSLWGVLLPPGLFSQVGGNSHTEVCR